jgi:uncharacterized protein
MLANPVDVLLVDEAGQLALADTLAASCGAKAIVLLGDPAQLSQVSKALHPGGSGESALSWVLGDHVTMPDDLGVFLTETWRMHPTITEFISERFYEGRLTAHPNCAQQRIWTPPEAGLVWIEAVHQDRTTASPEEVEIVREQVEGLLECSWTNFKGESHPINHKQILVVAPYNDQRRLLQEALAADPRTEQVQVGTVDKFQGKEAAAVLFTMASSTPEDMPRGPEFLFSLNRFNVAISRARCVTYLIATRALLDTRARTVEQIKLLSAVSDFVERARGAVGPSNG